MGSQENTIMVSLYIAVLFCLGAKAAPGANEMRTDEPLTISPDLIPMRKTVETTSEPLTISPNLILDRAINTCECAKATSSGRIVGGKEVSPKYKLPYQVFFQAGNFMCGGTIINKRYVITAAHCLYDQQTLMQPSTHNLLVMVGEHSICDGVNEGGKVIKVEKVHVRSDYGTPRQANDFAILKLAEDIKFTANIKPACLPEKNDKDYSGLWAIISGWGGTIGYTGAQPQQPRQCELKETSVKILKSSNERCTAVTQGDSKTRMCAFAKGTDSCQGDSGGPMTVVENGKYVLQHQQQLEHQLPPRHQLQPQHQLPLQHQLLLQHQLPLKLLPLLLLQLQLLMTTITTIIHTILIHTMDNYLMNNYLI